MIVPILFTSIIGPVLKSKITQLKNLAQQHFDTCKKLKNRLQQAVASKTNNQINELKRRLILKYYGIDDEGALSNSLYDTPKGNLRHLSSTEGSKK